MWISFNTVVAKRQTARASGQQSQQDIGPDNVTFHHDNYIIMQLHIHGNNTLYYATTLLCLYRSNNDCLS